MTDRDRQRQTGGQRDRQTYRQPAPPGVPNKKTETDRQTVRQRPRVPERVRETAVDMVLLTIVLSGS